MSPPKFKPKDYVIVTVRDEFKGNKLAVVVKLCPDHEGAYRVNVIDSENRYPDVCANPLRGDIIISAEKSDD